MANPIETILKNFIHHVFNLSMEEGSSDSGFQREFRMLRDIQIEAKKEGKYPTEDGQKEENMPKNRYKDILPCDNNRVKLKEILGQKGSDYINASFIDDVDGKNGYIASQGPMPHTVKDFWRMLWQYRIEIIFMACRVKEEGKPKCEQYWAEKGQSKTFADITVHTLSEEEIQEHFVKRQLHVEKAGEKEKLKMIQFQYVGWPDHNTPSSPDALRTMIEKVRDMRHKHKVPMVVHCSAGCGRTGTICAIDYAWTLLDKGMVTGEFSMFNIIRSIREQRMSMVQTSEQYKYTHMVMRSLCNEWLADFRKSDYENVTIGGLTTNSEEESYCNVQLSQDQTCSSRETSNDILVTTTAKGTPNAPARTKPVITTKMKPEVTKQKPELTKQRPEIIKKKPEIHKQKPDVIRQKHDQHREKVSGGRTSPAQEDRPVSSNKYKTVINVSGGETLRPVSGKIGSSTVGRSAFRQQAPRAGVPQTLLLQRDKEEAANCGDVYGTVVKPNKADGTGRNVDALYSMATDVSLESPDLPIRQYRPEEVASVGNPSAAKRSSGQHSYDNITLCEPSATPPLSPSTKLNQFAFPGQASPRSAKPKVFKGSQTVSAAASGNGVRTRSRLPELPSAPAADHTTKPQTAAGGGNVLQSKAGKFWMERAPRVTGPRPLPSHWNVNT